jgi:hypothetical protein
MTKRLTERGIPFEYEEFDDGHMSVQYRYDVSLPKIAHALAPAEKKSAVKTVSKARRG